MKRRNTLIGIFLGALTLVTTGSLFIFQDGRTDANAPDPLSPAAQAVVPTDKGRRIVPLDSYAASSSTAPVQEAVAATVPSSRIVSLDSYNKAQGRSATIAGKPSPAARSKR